MSASVGVVLVIIIVFHGHSPSPTSSLRCLPGNLQPHLCERYGNNRMTLTLISALVEVCSWMLTF